MFHHPGFLRSDGKAQTWALGMLLRGAAASLWTSLLEGEVSLLLSFGFAS